jgi:hypothetical protein
MGMHESSSLTLRKEQIDGILNTVVRRIFWHGDRRLEKTA